MLKKFLALVAMLYAATCFAAVDVNKASAAELDGIKGIGPGISAKILDERKKGSFKDWNDFVERVKGVGEGNAAKFSSEGLTVNGAAFKGVTVAPAAKKDDKPVAKTEEKKADAKPVAAAKEEKKDPKAEAKAAKEAEKKAKADEKMKKAEEAKAKKDAGKKAADAKPAAKDEKKDAKAEAAKPAASAPKK